MTLVRLVGQAQNSGSLPQPKAVALGLGGAGNDLLTHLMEVDVQGVQCIAVDTDRYDLQIARAHSKFLIQHAVAAGSRGDIEIGRELGQQISRELQPVLGGSEIVFVLAGMGGGTGGGTAPIVAENARKNGALVIGLITRPFQFERGRFHVAVNSIRKMVNACDTVILIDNHTFEPSSMTLPFGLSLDTAGQTCCSIVLSLVHTFAGSGLCNAELGELRRMLRRGGLAKAGVAHSHSHLGAEEAALRAIRNTIARGDLADANGVFVNIAGGNHVQRAHVESAVQLFSRSVNPMAQFLYGHRVDTNMLALTRVTLLATGVPFPFSWGKYRGLPLELYDLEPESAEEEDLSLKLELRQLESYAN
jgi:cell division protein FtsZ